MNEQQRIAAWDKEAREILESVRKYEDEHPQGALCLHPMLMVIDQCGAVETSPLGHVYPNAGACGREGCPVLHDDPANPIHPEDLTKDFHERTGRCLGWTGDPKAQIHVECAHLELAHRQGVHFQCLPVEDGFTEAEVHQAQMYLDSDEYDGAYTDVGEYLRAQRLAETQDRVDRDLHVAAMLMPPRVGPMDREAFRREYEGTWTAVERCPVRIDMGLGDVQQCERPADGRHARHQVGDYHGSPLVWLEDHPRSRSAGEVTAVEVGGIRVEYGANRVRSDWDTLTGDQKMQARLDGTEYREPTLEERVAALEARLARLESQPSAFDVIGDR